MDTLRYRWERSDHAEPFPTDQLAAVDIPPPLVRADDHDRLQLVNRFAHTFNGYDWAGSLEELGDRYHEQHGAWLTGSVLTDDVDALRSYLFFWFRADRHGGGYGPYEHDLVWLTALLDALRRSLPPGDARPGSQRPEQDRPA